MSLLMDVLILSTAWTHVLLSPYTKVEESFNLHATHDVLMYGLSTSSLPKYDHFVFPGAVPRSFLGSIVLAWLSRPVIHVFNSYGFISSKADLQIVVRLVLATLNALSLCTLRRAVQKRFGFSTAVFFTLLSCTQFHLPFWMGKTLPNMFALGFVNLAYALLLSLRPNSTRPSASNVRLALSLLIFAAIVFRAELLLLLAPLALQALLCRWIGFWELVRTGVGVGVGSILLTTLLDSYLWSTLPTPLWPELHSLYYNVYLNNSSHWGVSPYHSYFTSHLPKLLLSSLPLALVGLVVEPRRVGIGAGMVASVGGFVGAMSALGHKEWRFVVYVVPAVNVAAARGAYWLARQRTRTILGRLSLLILIGCIAFNTLLTLIMTQVSMANYPGGVALQRFNTIFNGAENVHVHISNLAAQTGASLFLQVYSPPYPSFLPPSSSPPYSSLSPSRFLSGTRERNWIYNKTENLSPSDITSERQFTHAIVEFSTLDKFLSQDKAWEKVECIKAFDGFRVIRGCSGQSESGKMEGEGIWQMMDRLLGLLRIPRVGVRYADKLCILRRR